MGTDGSRSNRFAHEAGRLLDEARALSQGSGRLAARGAWGRVRARMGGQQPALRWVPSQLAPRYDVIVVGATLPGLFLAHELAPRLEARIALLEADRVGANWPSRSRSALSVLRDHPVLSDLVVRSQASYERLAGDAFQLGFGHADVVTLARSASELARRSARSTANRPLLVSRPEAGSVGELLGDPWAADVLLEPNVTVVRAPTLPWELASAAAARRVAIVEHCRLSGAARVDGSWRLSTSAGSTEAPLVIDATAGAEALVAAGMDHHCLWRRWEALTTDPVQPFLRADVHAGGVEIHQTEQGEISISGSAGTVPPGATAAWLPTAATLAASAVDALPLVGQLRVASRAWRNDLVPVDGLPAVGAVSTGGDAEGLYRLGGLGADALALAPAAAESLAQHLVDEVPAVELAPVDPGRLRTADGRSWAEVTAR